MQIKKKLNNLSKLYIFFFSSLLFININLTTNLFANSFKITDLEISEPFELNFDKEKVIDKGFKEAFNQLISMVTTSRDKARLINTPVSRIKGLIDSFTMSNERFIKNRYHVKFDVNFNKKETLKFFEKKNIFPSIPIKKDILLIPVLIDLETDTVSLFTNNLFYKEWNKKNKRYYLLNYLLPTEDLEDVGLLKKNSINIEDYGFKDLIKKYDLKDFIITIIYKDENKFKVLSKININNTLKLNNQKFDNVDISNQKKIEEILFELKNTYENYWKKINQINTSIKLPLTISINAKDYKKIGSLEKTFMQLDLISSFEIFKITNESIYYKIIYNGQPNNFLENIKKKGFIIETQNQIWEIQ